MTRLLAVALAVVLAVSLTGCGDPDRGDGTTPGEGAVPSDVSSATADGADAASDGSSASDQDGATAAGGSGTATGVSVDSAATSEILLELDAVRRELDRVSLPDDTDFADIEAAIK